MEDVKQVHAHERRDIKPPTYPQRVKRSRYLTVKNGVILVLAIGLMVLIIGYIHTKKQLNQLSNSNGSTQSVIDKVSRLAELPSGETPTLATVKDVNKLKNQQFFNPAQNGDKVLIYTKSGWAVLYRPSTNKVIEIAQINLNGQ